jgi:hypothetical protein
MRGRYRRGRAGGHTHMVQFSEDSLVVVIAQSVGVI